MAAQPEDLSTVIDAHLGAFDKPGVLSVRPGFKVTDGWITDRRAVVVTVEQKVTEPPPGEMLPSEVGGVPVDVRQASPRNRTELTDPSAYAAQLRLSPDTGSVPHFPDERLLDGTRPAATASAHAALAAKVVKHQLPYTAPPDSPLVPTEVEATLLLSASPDTGWATLKNFLAATTESLTVGLYDFTSAHVLDTVQTTMAGKQLTLVLDHPPTNHTADQTDEQTVADLTDKLAGDFTHSWALTRLDKQASAWIYPTSYHIKVAVRDNTACWLSSGNWNNSNQPDIDPITVQADKATARHRDRDWHVVIEQPAIAGLFASYLTHDRATAAVNNNVPGDPGPPLTPPPLGTTETPAYHEFFPSKQISGTIKITPLLTPDPGCYVDAVKALIDSATTTLYMQFQYIELPKTVNATSQAFADLVQAVIDRQNAGVDLRIIMSEYEVAGYLEQLQALGLDTVTKVKIQNNVHNKGIIVDGRTVLISSQNWSTDGTLYNRDAGVIIDNTEAATYFQQIFLHDWEHLTVRKVHSD